MLNKYIIRSINSSSLAIATIFLLLILGNKAINILKDLNFLHMSPIFLTKQILLNIPFALTLILPLAFTFSTMLNILKLSETGEINVMLSAGKSYKSIFAPIFLNSLVYMLIGLFLTLYLAPYSQNLSFKLMNSEQMRVDLDFIMPQSMQSFAGYGIYVENLNEDKTELYDVLLFDNKNNIWEVIKAQKARQIIVDDTYKVLFLQNGKRYRIPSSSLAIEQLEFENSAKIIGKLTKPSNPEILQALSTKKLLGSDNLSAKAQIQWRLGIPLLSPLLIFPAFALGLINKRRTSYIGMLPVLIIILISIFACFALERSVANNSINIYPGVFYIHLVLVVFAFAVVKYKKIFSKIL